MMRKFTSVIMVAALLSLTAAADPTVTNAGFHGGLFLFSVKADTIPNTGYAIEYKHDLTDASWTMLTSFLADDQVRQVTDPAPAPNRRFYRIRTVMI